MKILNLTREDMIERFKDISDVRDAYRKLKNKGTITVKELIDLGFKGA